MLADEFTFNQVRQILMEALNDLSKEPKLFSYRINERTLTQRLSLHLQRRFGDEISVDCEYNRMWENDEDLVKELPWGPEEVWTDDSEGRTVYPDIISHRRGGQFDNLLVIEAKRNHAGDSLPYIDERKLERFTHSNGDFRYRHGAFINFLTAANPKRIKITWFENASATGEHDEIEFEQRLA